MNDLKCPSEFVRHLSCFNVFGHLAEVSPSVDKNIERDNMNEINEKYYDSCRNAGIDVVADDRKARIGFFII